MLDIQCDLCGTENAFGSLEEVFADIAAKFIEIILAYILTFNYNGILRAVSVYGYGF